MCDVKANAALRAEFVSPPSYHGGCPVQKQFTVRWWSHFTTRRRLFSYLRVSILEQEWGCEVVARAGFVWDIRSSTP